MASANKTSHLQLNQWAADDQVLRVDFNSDNLKVDEAIKQFVPVKGEYSGTGYSKTQIIELGFWPRMIVASINTANKNTNGIRTRDSLNPVNLILTETGFSAYGYFNDSGTSFTYLAWR